MEVTDPGTNSPLLESNEDSFESLFAEWFGNLYSYAFSVLKDASAAEEVVQSVFCRLWEKRDRLQVTTSFKAYLYGSVYHECVNWLRRKKKNRKYRLHILQGSNRDVSDSAAASVELGELEKRLHEAMNELPERCRAIFYLSRFGQMGYREIAGQLGISVKTVEAQISKALKHMRKSLVDFL